MATPAGVNRRRQGENVEALGRANRPDKILAAVGVSPNVHVVDRLVATVMEHDAQPLDTAMRTQEREPNARAALLKRKLPWFKLK